MSDLSLSRSRPGRVPGRRCAWLLLMAAALPLAAAAETKLDIRANTAAYVLEEFQALPESGIPPALLQRAAGIAIVPNVLKVGFGLGARFGRGVLLVRDDGGDWRGPVFITVGSGSIGWQLGAQAADLVLVFRDRETLLNIDTSKFTLGADAAVAAGPVGRFASAATDVKFDAAVYSYSRTRGLFAGIALDGAVLTIDHKDNARYYSDPGATLGKLVTQPTDRAPASARQLLAGVARHSGPSGAAGGGGTAAATGTTDDDNGEPAVRTFGIGEEPLEADSGAAGPEN
ncbi:MAG: lipid-binding SYLF domain-containing protein [Pseudomonadota bacterium]